MSEQDKKDAAKHASRAGSQAKHAVRNTGRAAADVASVAADEGKDLAQDAVNMTKDVGHDSVEAAEKAAYAARARARDFSPRGLASVTGDTGQGFIALSVALWAGSIAFNKFSAAYTGRNRALRARPR